MSEISTALIELKASGDRFTTAMVNANEAVEELFEAMWQQLPLWKRASFTVRHPLAAFWYHRRRTRGTA